jgi:hypothetical protein
LACSLDVSWALKICGSVYSFPTDSFELRSNRIATVPYLRLTVQNYFVIPLKFSVAQTLNQFAMTVTRVVNVRIVRNGGIVDEPGTELWIDNGKVRWQPTNCFDFYYVNKVFR